MSVEKHVKTALTRSVRAVLDYSFDLISGVIKRRRRLICLLYAQAVSMGQKRLLKTTPLEASMVTVVPFFRMFVADSAPTITGFSNARPAIAA